MTVKQKSAFEKYVSAAVRKKRMERNAKQADIAYILEVSDGFISQIENPNSPSKYNLDHLNEIAKFLECSPRDFLPEKSF